MYVDECRGNKQVLLNYMGWLRKQPLPKRKHGNPERTLANRVGDVRIFLKEFGITKLLKNQYLEIFARMAHGLKKILPCD